MLVDITQSIEGLNRTKRQKDEFAVFLCWVIHLLLPLGIRASGSGRIPAGMLSLFFPTVVGFQTHRIMTLAFVVL
jgi:hypothetical protein